MEEVPEGFKRCSKCGEIKPCESFYVKDVLRSIRSNICKSCTKKQRGEYYKKNSRRIVKANSVRKKYINDKVLKSDINLSDKRMGMFDKTEEQKFDEMVKENEKKWKEYAEKNGIKQRTKELK